MYGRRIHYIKVSQRMLHLIIVLGRFDIAHATSAVSRFNMSPSEGYLKVVKGIIAYLSLFQREGL
jgi:hypothetical protein